MFGQDLALTMANGLKCSELTACLAMSKKTNVFLNVSFYSGGSSNPVVIVPIINATKIDSKEFLSFRKVFTVAIVGRVMLLSLSKDTFAIIYNNCHFLCTSGSTNS